MRSTWRICSGASVGLWLDTNAAEPAAIGAAAEVPPNRNSAPPEGLVDARFSPGAARSVFGPYPEPERWPCGPKLEMAST